MQRLPRRVAQGLCLVAGLAVASACTNGGDKQGRAVDESAELAPATGGGASAGISWRDATNDNLSLSQVSGADEWAAGIVELGYQQFGLNIDGVPEDKWVDYGIAFCGAADAAGGDVQAVMRNAASTTGSGVILTQDFTLDMYEAQFRLATATLCPEFDDWPAPADDTTAGSYEDILDTFLNAWASQDIAGMALVSANPADLTVDTAAANPLVAPAGDVDCEDGADGLVNCYVETSAGPWGITVQLLPNENGAYEVLRLLPTDVG